MDVLTWIDKDIHNVKEDLLFIKYFEIESIEKIVDEYYFFNKNLGIDLVIDENYFIKAIHFFSGNQEDINQYTELLPFDLKFYFSREMTKKLLGEPRISGGGDFSFLHGITPMWDKYFFDKYSLHIQFLNDEKSIDLITVMTLLE